MKDIFVIGVQSQNFSRPGYDRKNPLGWLQPYASFDIEQSVPALWAITLNTD